MTAFTLDENPAQYQIRAFKKGVIQVNDHVLHTSIIITPHTLIEWPLSSIAQLTPETLEKIVEIKPNILLIGTGETLIFPPLECYGHLLNCGIGVEIMHSAAACRTYSALSSENRNVAAAIIV